MNVEHLILVLLINIPAYVCAGLALRRKLRDADYGACVTFSILLLLLLADAVLVSQLFYVETCTPTLLRIQAGVSVLIVPVLYLFLAPESGETFINRTTIMLFALTLILLMPPMAWEIVPGYALTQYVEPQEILGISIFYQGQFVYHLYWAAIIMTLQSFVALTQIKHLYKVVKDHGAHYSWKARAAYYWDFSCCYFLALSFLFPLSLWQTAEMRWTYYLFADAILAIGCILVYIGFDLNPIVIHQRRNMTLSDFMLETGDRVDEMKRMLEEEKVYLEKGLQSDTMAQRLDISHSYFLRMMQAVYGCSFPEWVNNARIEYSKALLAENKYSLEQIASMCGYTSINSYVHLFRRITGQTPYEWLHAGSYIHLDDMLTTDDGAVFDDD